MLRICLIIALVAGLGTLAVSQLKVAENINVLKTDLTTTQENLTASKAAETTAKKKEREAKEIADKAKVELDDTKVALEASAFKAAEQTKRANDLEENLTKTTKDKNEAQAKLSEWDALERTPLEIRGLMAENKKLVGEREVVDKQVRTLAQKVNVLTNRLAIYEGSANLVRPPANLHGKVLAVDPKYEFVILNVGEKEGLLERAEVLVNRSGKLVAKLRVLSVDENRAVANVLPDWKQSDIMEGDSVVAGL